MDYASNSISAQKESKISRVNSDVERVLTLVRSVNDARDKVQRHTSALGYFSDAPASSGAQTAVKPVPINMQDAIGDLGHALDGLHAALSLFE